MALLEIAEAIYNYKKKWKMTLDEQKWETKAFNDPLSIIMKIMYINVYLYGFFNKQIVIRITIILFK